MNQTTNNLVNGADLSPEQLPQVRELEPGQVVAISSLIRYMSALRNPDPGEVAERDIRVLSPAYLRSGLYVPPDKKDSDYKEARDHVIFPADEYKIITTSPIRLASAAATGVRKKRQDDPDKERVEEIAGRASAKSLISKIEATERLRESLGTRYGRLATFDKELMSARGTGFLAHYGQENGRMLIAEAETEIFATLDIVAKTKGWDADQYQRAVRTLQYKLFGDHPDRYKNWKAFLPVAQRHLRRRRAVVLGVRQRLEKELTNYTQYLDEE